MLKDDLERIKNWFSAYTVSFVGTSETPFSLKVRHTHNVRANILRILKELPDRKDKEIIGEAIALLHDVGRFPQYEKYGTFMDSISVNHGKLGAEIIASENVLQGLSDSEKEIILQSVKYHNAYSLPDINNPEIIYFLRLIRDADKLDIWRIFAELYLSGKEDEIMALAPGVSNGPGYSQAVVEDIFNKRLSSTSKAKTLNDYKLIQLSWVFDLNFRASFRIMEENKYLDIIVSALLKSEEISKMSRLIKEYVSGKL